MAGLAHRGDRQGFHVAKAALAVTVDDDLANFELPCFGAVGDLDIEFGQLPRLPGVGGAGCRVTRLQADAAASDRARAMAAGVFMVAPHVVQDKSKNHRAAAFAIVDLRPLARSAPRRCAEIRLRTVSWHPLRFPLCVGRLVQA